LYCHCAIVAWHRSPSSSNTGVPFEKYQIIIIIIIIIIKFPRGG